MRVVEVDFPPRNAIEKKQWQRFRKCVRKFGLAARFENVKAMNDWSHLADALMWEYLERRRRTN